MILSQGILDELRHQAELQGKKNYRCIEVDWRTIVALCDEAENSRKPVMTPVSWGPILSALQVAIPDFRKRDVIIAQFFRDIRATSPPVDEPVFCEKKPDEFVRGERVVFAGKEYGFLAYSVDGKSCFLNPLESEDEGHSFAVLVCNVKKAPL